MVSGRLHCLGIPTLFKRSFDSCSLCSGAKLLEIEIPRQSAQETALDTLHSATLSKPVVVKAAQMKHPVNNVPNQLTLPGRVEPAALSEGFVQADKNLAVQGREAPLSAIVKRNDIS